MSDAEKILLIRLKSIGDILFTLPAVHRLRDNFPRARLSFMTSKEHAPILDGFAEVDETIALDRALFQQRRVKAIWAHTLEVMRRLRRGRFSLVVDFQGYGETALLTWLTGAPERWGSVYRGRRAWAYTKGPTRDDRIHPADWNLSLLGQCGLKPGPVRNEFHLPSDSVNSALCCFTEQHLDPARPTLYLQPYTSSPHKNWPLENYLVLAAHWRSRGLQIIFGGGPADRLALEPAHNEGHVVSAGVPMLTTAGLMKLSTVVVGGDTGVLHLAVAMGKRVVMVVNSTRPRTFPFGHPDWAVTPRDSQPAAGTEVGTVVKACASALTAIGGFNLS